MKNEYKIKALESILESYQFKLETLLTADLEPGDPVLYNDQKYYVFEVYPKYNGVCEYDLTKPKKDGDIPSRAINPVYCVNRNKLALIPD